MPADPKLQRRIDILTQAVAQGKALKPEHQREYDSYVKMGLAKTTNPEVDPDKREKFAALRALEEQILRVDGLYKKGPGATSGVWGAEDYLPTPANKAFNTAASGIGDVAFNAFRTPGAGAQSDAELKARLEATQPAASDFDATIEEKLNYLKTRLDETYRAMGVAPRHNLNDDDLIQKYLKWPSQPANN